MFTVLQGEEESEQDRIVIGRYKLAFESPAQKGQTYKVAIHADVNGSISV